MRSATQRISRISDNASRGVILAALLASLGAPTHAAEPSSAQAAKKSELIIPAGLRRGEYFIKKEYIPEALPTFEQVKDQLPEPVLPSRPIWQEMYWKCWQLAFSHLKQPQPGSPLISNWLDEAFSHVPANFQWDTCFMMMFARYGHAEFPFIQSLDNFYGLQRSNGYICRAIDERNGLEYNYGLKGRFKDPRCWANSINPPLFAWAEVVRKDMHFVRQNRRIVRL